MMYGVYDLNETLVFLGDTVREVADYLGQKDVRYIYRMINKEYKPKKLKFTVERIKEDNE